MIRLIGALLVCFACSFLGIHYGGKSERRLSKLLELKHTLNLLKSEIEYSINTLTAACINISKKAKMPLSQFYEDIGNVGIKPLDETWQNAVKNLNLYKDDAFNLSALGAALGNIDKDVQLKAIEISLINIDHNIQVLTYEKDKEKKLYRGLGILGGLFIVVVML